MLLYCNPILSVDAVSVTQGFLDPSGHSAWRLTVVNNGLTAASVDPKRSSSLLGVDYIRSFLSLLAAVIIRG
jgi:hypothetical protein